MRASENVRAEQTVGHMASANNSPNAPTSDEDATEAFTHSRNFTRGNRKRHTVTMSLSTTEFSFLLGRKSIL
jgi:hypothetical protein